MEHSTDRIAMTFLNLFLFLYLNRPIQPYFYTGFVAYFLGLLLTIFVMHVYKHAQPALLYLVICYQIVVIEWMKMEEFISLSCTDDKYLFSGTRVSRCSDVIGAVQRRNYAID